MIPPGGSSLLSVEPMQVDIDGENDNDTGILEFEDGSIPSVFPNFTVENPTFDLETAMQGYTGFARLSRLSFIANHTKNPLQMEALKMAINSVMMTYNVSFYNMLHKKLVESMSNSGNSSNSNNDNSAESEYNDFSTPSSSSSSLPALDHNWIENKNKKSALKLEKLDTDLKHYKSNSIKESIRRGHDDLGDHFLDCGDLSNALKCYSRARDYCTSGKHVVNMCINVIKVSVYLQNWSHVLSHVNKALSTPDFNELSSTKGTDHLNILTRLHCAHGLAELASRKYKSAAKRFLQANLDNCDIPDMMSPQNVATYGGLCALATFDRVELKRQVISSSSFKLFLELDPALREALFNFYHSKYGACLRQLEDMKDNLLIDIYLSPHVNTLYSMIRNRALIQYFSPYLRADMKKMAHSFNTSLQGLEDELMTLIYEGQIKARIDSHNKVLYAQDVNQRNLTFERAMETGATYQRRSKILILRSAILKHNIMIKAPNNRVESSASEGNHVSDGN